jgi:hypothetical protein
MYELLMHKETESEVKGDGSGPFKNSHENPVLGS